MFYELETEFSERRTIVRKMAGITYNWSFPKSLLAWHPEFCFLFRRFRWWLFYYFKSILSNFKNGKIKTNQLLKPGLHKISNESKILAQSSVNVNKSELINNLIDIEDIILNKSNNMSLIEYDDNIIADLHDARTGSELWRPILYLITILLM